MQPQATKPKRAGTWTAAVSLMIVAAWAATAAARAADPLPSCT